MVSAPKEGGVTEESGDSELAAYIEYSSGIHVTEGSGTYVFAYDRCTELIWHFLCTGAHLVSTNNTKGQAQIYRR